MMPEPSFVEVVLRISLAPALMAFLLGLPAGLAALPSAWWGKFDSARGYAWFHLKVGGVAGLWLAVVTAKVGFDNSWIFIVPGALSVTALVYAHYYQANLRLSRFQFTIPLILYATMLAAIVTMGVSYWLDDGTDHTAERELAANLARMSAIEDVRYAGGTRTESIGANVLKKEFIVSQISFSLAGRPDTLVQIFPDDRLRTCDSGEPLSRVTLRQVGRWRLRGAILADPPATPLFIDSINVEPNGAFQNLFPFPLRSVDDIVDNYDELVKLLETWPREDQPGRVEHDGISYEYWVEDDGP